MNIGQQPVLILVVLLAGSIACALVPASRQRLCGLLGGIACLLALAGVADVAPLTASGPLSPSFGEVVNGVPLALRVDATGLTLVVVTVVAALLALTAPGRRSGEEAAIMLTAVGAGVAALAGNAVVLFAGVEIANLGGLLLARAAAGRLSRAAMVGFAIQHAFALGLLAAAVQLVVATGTSDPYSVPPSALGLPVALPWALAGAARLLSAAWWPGSSGSRSTRAALAVGAIPCGGAVLLRLTAGLDGASEPALITWLSAVGVAAGLAGGLAAWRWQGDPRRAAAGPVVVLAGVPGGGGGFAAGLLAFELAALAAPAWSRGIGSGRSARGMAALALAAAGGLPIGFGTTALVLELGSLAALGPAYAAVLFGLGATAMLAVGASLAAARRALGAPSAAAGVRWRPDAALGLAFGALAALLPGATAQAVLVPLVGGAAPGSADLASLSGSAGSWPGGYLSLALLVVVLAVACAAILLGRALPHPGHGEPGPERTPAWLALAASRRRARPVLAWLVSQPGLIFAVVAALAAILLFK